MNTKSIIFQCPEDLKNESTKHLADCGVTMSEYLRLCLEYFVERRLSVKIKADIQNIAEQVIIDSGLQP